MIVKARGGTLSLLKFFLAGSWRLANFQQPYHPPIESRPPILHNILLTSCL